MNSVSKQSFEMTTPIDISIFNVVSSIFSLAMFNWDKLTIDINYEGNINALNVKVFSLNSKYLLVAVPVPENLVYLDRALASEQLGVLKFKTIKTIESIDIYEVEKRRGVL
ncbi:hypothetical protein MT391_20070 [Vibrio sp. 1-Bac 57]